MFTFQENWEIYFSVFVMIFFCLKTVHGYRTGILRRLIGLFGSIVSYWIAWLLSGLFAKYIVILPANWNFFQNTIFAGAAKQYLNQICWFILLFLCLRIGFFLIDRIAKGVHKIPGLHMISSILGACFGFAESFVWMIVLSILLNTPLFSNGNYIVEHSLLKQVNNLAEVALKEYAEPLIGTEGFDKLGKDFQALSEQQKQVIEKWLLDNGYVDQSNQIQ